MKRFLFLLAFLFFTCNLYGQVIYVSNYDYTSGGQSYVHKITISPTGITDEVMNTCPGANFFSIAARGDKFYWLDGGTYLFQADIQGNSLVNCKPIGPSATVSNSLSAGNDNRVYYTYDQLYAMDVTTGQSTALGYLHYGAAGDITFYKGNIYMASSGIVKIDPKNPSGAYVYINENLINDFGLISVANGLHSTSVYLLMGDKVNPNYTQICPVDLDHGTIGASIGTLPYQVLDAASSTEDGSILGIQIDKVNLHQDCNAPTRGIAEVITEAHNDVFTYTLSNGDTNTTGVFSNLAPGNYHLTVKSSLDFQETDFTMPAYTLTKPVYSYTVTNQLCDAAGQITFASGDVNSKKYMVTDGTDTFPIDHVFTGYALGVYQFSLLNEFGCQADQVSIEVKRDKCPIQFDKAVVAKECNAVSKGSITMLTKTHTDTYSYMLNGITNDTGVFNMIDPGNYTVTITSSEDQQQVPVTVPDYGLTKLAITAVSVNPVCDVAGSILFSTTATGQYRVTDGVNTYPLPHQFTGLAAATYQFSFLDAQGCLVDQQTVTLLRDKCTIKFDRTDVQQQCDAIHKGALQVVSKPHSDQYSYTLNGVTNTTGAFNLLDPGVYIVNITSPEDQLNVDITVPDYSLLDPVVTYNNVDPFCAAKGSIQLKMPNSAVYQVSNNGVTYAADHIFNNLDAGDYSFTLLKNGCMIANYSTSLKYQPCPIVINNVAVNAECNALGKALIQVSCPSIPETYTYTLNGVTNGTGVFNMLDPGSYQLTVSASGGNTPQQQMITVPDFSLSKPLTVVNSKLPVCDLFGQISLQISGTATGYQIRYDGSIYRGDHVFTNLLAGLYHFEILKSDGCIVDAMDVNLTSELCSPVSFPSAFTPNGDGLNDVFRANPESRASGYHLQVFNRMGIRLFDTTDLHGAWDGQYHGQPVPAGTYYWMATFISQENKPVKQNGYVLLVR